MIITHIQILKSNLDSKVHGANMEPIWGRQDPGGIHVGPMNFAIWELILAPFYHTNVYLDVS